MKIDKSLQEVWDWKDKVYQETETLSVKEAGKKISEDVREISKKYKLNLRKLNIIKK